MRQTDIPTVSVGEAITAGLLNQLATGNAARMVTGDGSIEVTQIGGSIGVGDSRPQVVGDRDVLVRVSTTTVAVKLTPKGLSAVTIAGMYKGTIYLSPVFVPQFTEYPSTEGITTPSPPSIATNCYVINESEINTRTNLLPSAITTTGRIVGVFLGLPLVWVKFSKEALFIFNSTNVIGSVVQTLAGGVYAGRVATSHIGDITVTGTTFNLATLAVDPGTNNSYFFNLPEMGKTTHDLLSTSNSATLVSAINIGVSNGYPVFAGTMIFPGC